MISKKLDKSLQNLIILTVYKGEQVELARKTVERSHGVFE